MNYQFFPYLLISVLPVFLVTFFSSQIPIILLTVKIVKIGTPKIITIIVLQLEQLDFAVQ